MSLQAIATWMRTHSRLELLCCGLNGIQRSEIELEHYSIPTGLGCQLRIGAHSECTLHDSATASLTILIVCSAFSCDRAARYTLAFFMSSFCSPVIQRSAAARDAGGTKYLDNLSSNSRVSYRKLTYQFRCYCDPDKRGRDTSGHQCHSAGLIGHIPVGVPGRLGWKYLLQHDA